MVSITRDSSKNAESQESRMQRPHIQLEAWAQASMDRTLSETDHFSRYPKYCLHPIFHSIGLPLNFRTPTFGRVTSACRDLGERCGSF
jgi:hypothetical protein